MFEKSKLFVLLQQNHNRSNESETQKVVGELVITGGNVPKLFEFVEEDFDQVAFFILMEIALPRINCVVLRWNTIRGAL